MAMSSRGWILSLTAATLLTGCTSQDNPGWSEQGGVAIDEDKYFTFGFEASRTVTLSIDVRVTQGPAIDVFVFDELNFQSFKAGDSARPYSGCTGEATKTFVTSCNLSQGAYYVVLDNTDVGSAPPFNAINDVASVDYDLRAY